MLTKQFAINAVRHSTLEPHIRGEIIARIKKGDLQPPDLERAAEQYDWFRRGPDRRIPASPGPVNPRGLRAPFLLPTRLPRPKPKRADWRIIAGSDAGPGP